MITVDVLGAAGTYPAPTQPASGFLVRTGGASIWCDAGPGTFQALTAIAEPSSLDAVVLSHLHPDHCSDLFSLVHYLAYGPAASLATIDVYAPQGAGDRFAAFLDAGPDHAIHRVLRFHDANPGLEFQLGNARVAFAGARHTVPAVLIRIQTESSSMVYTGDTGPTAELDSFAAGVDTLIAEASLGPADDPFPFHMTAQQAAEAGLAAGVRRLILTHLRPTLDSDEALALAKATFGDEVYLATGGLSFEI